MFYNVLWCTHFYLKPIIIIGEAIFANNRRQWPGCAECRSAFLKVVYDFYVDCRACIRVGIDVCEWFPGTVGLRQAWVTSPCLWNLYMDGVVGEVMLARTLGNI